MSTWIGALEFDLLLGPVSSLKEKRSVVRPIVADLLKTFAVSVAEVGAQDLHRRSVIAVAVVTGDHGHLIEVLDRIERRVAGRPEAELCSARRLIRTMDD